MTTEIDDFSGDLNYEAEVGDGVGDADTEEADGGEAEMMDQELEAIKARVRAMEDEAEKLKQMQFEVDKQLNVPTSPGAAIASLSFEEKMEVDARSVYIGNVDYGATAEELESHFHGCGSINRVTILCNKLDGHPGKLVFTIQIFCSKGFAYVEFTDKDSVSTAMALDESLFRGRQIKVMPKRTNKHGISSTNRPPRGRGARGRSSRGRGGFGYMRRPRRARGSYYSPY